MGDLVERVIVSYEITNADGDKCFRLVSLTKLTVQHPHRESHNNRDPPTQLPLRHDNARALRVGREST